MYIQKSRLIILAVVLLLTTAAAPFAKNLVPTANSKITLTPAEAMPQFENTNLTRYVNLLNGNGWFYIPIHLPGSKVITQLKIYYTDTSGSSDPCFTLFQTKPNEGTATPLADICGSDTTGDITTLTVSNINKTISPSEGLVFFMNIADDHNFYGAKVFYRKP